MVAVVVAVQMAVTRSYRSSLKREPHEVNGYMIGQIGRASCRERV